MILSTQRLALSKLSHTDADFILHLLNTPTWLRYIGDRNVKTSVDAIRYIEDGPMKSYAARGYGLSKVSLLQTGEPIGLCGLLVRDYLQAPDIGFAFLPEHSGKGYGYEIASATIAHHRRIHQVTTICAITVPDNHASIALLKKLCFIEKKKFNREGEELLLFERYQAQEGY
jgi:[ribosomal protein S5]-alanine N-acetyltransferase